MKLNIFWKLDYATWNSEIVEFEVSSASESELEVS